MKKIIACALAALFCLAQPAAIGFAFEMPSHIRVGLESKYAGAQSIDVFNAAILCGYADGVNFREVGSFNGSGTFAVKPSDGYFVQVGGAYASFNQAKEQANAYRGSGHSAAVAFLNPGFGLYLGVYDSKADASKAASGVNGTVVEANSKRVVIYDGTTLMAVFDGGSPLVSDQNGTTVSLGDRNYRGGVEFTRFSGGNITAVNVLTIDEYLMSVVPSEMPQSWPIEALKAQTVAARSYSLTRINAHTASGYNFCDKTHCQSYLGAGNEAQNTNDAVMATQDILALYGGEPINAVYSSSSGGYTESSENTWTEAVPYLRGVADTFETSGMVWTRSFTMQELEALAPGIGKISGVKIDSVSAGGRVLQLTIQGASGSKVLTKEGIRTFFNASKDGMLESRNFTMPGATSSTTVTNVAVADLFATAQAQLSTLYAVAADGAIVQLDSVSAVGNGTAAAYQGTVTTVSGGSSVGNTAVFSGKGWGHGVGLSQYGARDMALAGFGFEDILKHYYTGIEVR